MKFVSGVQAGNVWGIKRSRFKAGSGRIRYENGNKKKKELQKHGMLEISIYWEWSCFRSFIVQTTALVLVHISCAFRSPCLVGSGRIRYDYLRRPIHIFEWLGEASCASLDNETGLVGFVDEID